MTRLPTTSGRWMRDYLGGPVPQEPLSTCHDCAMCPEDGTARPDPERYFHPSIKCCTYTPAIPNYLVGRILSVPSVEERISARAGVTPLGLETPAPYAVLYDASPLAFGRSRSMRCPHYDEASGGRCGIWRYRPAICATWFCKHERGATGDRFWRALRDLLDAAEAAVSLWCVIEIMGSGAPLDALTQRAGMENGLTAAALDGGADPGEYARLWGAWAGKEHQFYRESARRARRLAWRDVARIGGVRLAALGQLAKHRLRELQSERVPQEVEPGPFRILELDARTCRLATYSHYNPVEVPVRLLDWLPRFRGRTTREAIRALTREEGIELSDGLVRKLVDYELLAPVIGNPR